jgi:mannose-6-phosphate isomerase-like protein (cupin superfamily)
MAQVRDEVDIRQAARGNDAFRRVLITGEHAQVVVMTLPAGEEIGEEVHPDTDQLLLFIEGRGEAQLDGRTDPIDEDDLVFVRAGTRHNFVNTGGGPLRILSVYAPPQHPHGTVHLTKADAEAAERDEPGHGHH